jgi:hypothetical protein
MCRMRQGNDSKRTSCDAAIMVENEVKPDIASLVADIAREECKKLYEKRLVGLEEELAAIYRTLEEYTHRM